MGTSERCRMESGDLGTVDEDALLAAIVRSACDPMILIDRAGHVRYWNEGASRLFGHGAREMVGQPIGRIIPADRHEGEAMLVRRILDGLPVAPYRSRRMTRAGRECRVAVSLSPVHDSDGAIVAVSMILRETAARSTAQDVAWTQMDACVPAAASSLPRSILVVEDEALTALSLAALLERAGFAVIGPVGDVRSAMALLERQDCALAILDVKLGLSETSAPLAEKLSAMGIPFFVTSGYAADQHPPAFGQGRHFAKPVGARHIVAAVRETIAA